MMNIWHTVTHDYNGQIDWFATLLFGGIVLVLALLILGMTVAFIHDMIDHKRSKTVKHRYKVMQKHYTAERSSTGVGPVIGTQGGVAVISTHSDAEYSLELRSGDVSEIYEVSRKDYLKVVEGETYLFAQSIGGLSNCVLNTWLAER